MLKLKKSGFTFIETLVVVVLIGILTAIGVVTYGGTKNKARDSERKSDLELIRSALEMYKADNASGLYPNDILIGSLGSYLPNGIPVDPNTDVAYSYVVNGANTAYCLQACLENDDPVGVGLCSIGLPSCTSPLNSYIMLSP